MLPSPEPRTESVFLLCLIFVVILRMTAKCVLKRLDRLAERATDLRESTRPKKQQGDREDGEELTKSKIHLRRVM